MKYVIVWTTAVLTAVEESVKVDDSCRVGMGLLRSAHGREPRWNHCPHPLLDPSCARRKRITREQVQHGSRQDNQRITQWNSGVDHRWEAQKRSLKADVHENDRTDEHQ